MATVYFKKGFWRPKCTICTFKVRLTVKRKNVKFFILETKEKGNRTNASALKTRRNCNDINFTIQLVHSVHLFIISLILFSFYKKNISLNITKPANDKTLWRSSCRETPINERGLNHIINICRIIYLMMTRQEKSV